MATRYVDFQNGDDANDGLSFANRKKTITSACQNSLPGDDVRVMKSSDPVSVGNCTWVAAEKDRYTYVTGYSNNNGEIQISISNYFTNWLTGEYVTIANGGRVPQILGVWKITKVSNNAYVLQGSDYASLTDAGSGDLGHIINSTGSIVTVPSQLLTSIDPQWTALTLANPVSAWVNSGAVDGITNGANYIPGSQPAGADTKTGPSLFESRPGSSWRIKWINSNQVTVTEVSYVDTRAYIASGYYQPAASYYGYNDTSVYMPTGYIHYFAGSNYYYGAVNSNSYFQWGTWYNQTSGFDADTPPYRQYQIGAGENAMNFLRQRSYCGISQYADVQDASGNGNGCVGICHFLGNIGPNRYYTAGYDLEWEAIFFQRDATMVQFNIHANANWTFSTLQPSATVVAGKYDTGTEINMAGSPAQTETHWYDFPSTLDLSARDAISLFVKNAGAQDLDIRLRLSSSVHGGGGTVTEFTLPMSTIGSDWTPVTLSTGSNLPSNIQSISIYYAGTSDVTETKKFSISNISAITSTGIGFDDLIGLNTTASPLWYRIYAMRVKYGNTLITLQNSKDTETEEVREFGLTYLGPKGLDLSDGSRHTYTVETYVRKAIPVTTLQYIAPNNVVIKGGYDETDMSTVTGQTWINCDPANNGIEIVGSAVYLENIHLMNAATGLYLSGSNRSNEVQNCSFNFCTNGLYSPNSWQNRFRNVTFMGCQTAIYLTQNGSGDFTIKDSTFECNNTGMLRECRNVSTSLYNCNLRGHRGYSIYNRHILGTKDYQNNITSHYYHAIYLDDTQDYVFSGGKIKKALNTLNSYEFVMNNDAYNTALIDTDVQKYTYPGTFGMQASYVRSRNGFITAKNGDGLQVRHSFHAAWEKNDAVPDSALVNGTTVQNCRWDGTDPRGKIWKVYRTSSGAEWGWASSSTAWRRKIAQVPMTAGTAFSISIRTLRSQPNYATYGKLAIVVDNAESTIGLTSDYFLDVTTQAGATWQQYTAQLTALKTGVAEVYLAYWVEGSNTTGSTTAVYYDDIQVSG